MVSLMEAKNYIKVDFDDDDELIVSLIKAAQKLCMNVARTDDEEEFYQDENSKNTVLYTVAYLYEHREEADHHNLTSDLRSLLFALREKKVMF